MFSDVGVWGFIGRLTSECDSFKSILEVFFQLFFAVFSIGRISNGQKIKGAVKQCIDWVDTMVDTMIARKSIMPDVV